MMTNISLSLVTLKNAQKATSPKWRCKYFRYSGIFIDQTAKLYSLQHVRLKNIFNKFQNSQFATWQQIGMNINGYIQIHATI